MTLFRLRRRLQRWLSQQTLAARRRDDLKELSRELYRLQLTRIWCEHEILKLEAQQTFLASRRPDPDA